VRVRRQGEKMTKERPIYEEVEPMEMKVLGFNIFPLIVFLFNLIPDSWRKSMMSKQNAPKPKVLLRDIFDLTGESPYEKEEVVPGKVWAVTYKCEDAGSTREDAKNEAKAFGMDPTSAEFKRKCLEAAATHGPRAVEVCKADLVKAVEVFNKNTYTDEELKDFMTSKLRMFVVRLSGGSLLLYSPCRIREDAGLKAWLDSLGRVDWIVVGSCYHTLNLQAVIKQYPEARVVGTPAAQDKLNVIKALPREKFDVNAEDKDKLASLNLEMEKEGVKFFYVEGDVATNALITIAHGVALNVDLLYGKHDGSVFDIEREEWNQYKAEHYWLRLFYLLTCSRPNSPNGYLATYRFQMMDPYAMGAMSYDQPARDGSTCGVMARSLRKLLQLDFELAYDVHSGKSSRKDFQLSIDANWNWLDGKSLL